jgi:hypothetical protein
LKKCCPSAESFEMLSTVAASLCKLWQAVDFSLSALFIGPDSSEDNVALAVDE